jgi:hypothetical protein
LLGYRPLVYFWIAEYSDGTALPQFDPATGKENSFSKVDQTRLSRFGWYPFTVDLAQKILKAEKLVVFPAKNRSYSVSLNNGERLVAHRTNTVTLKTGDGTVCREETVYVLGIENGNILQITEGGELVSPS